LNGAIAPVAIVVNVEAIAGRPTNRCDSIKLGAICTPDKVVGPILLAGMKQGQHSQGFTVSTNNEIVATLVAAATGQRQII
jgi:hypothetical protein